MIISSLIIFMTTLTISCSTSDPDFDKGMLHFEHQEYHEATKFFENVIAKSRSSSLVEEAKHKLEQAYYLAASSFFKEKKYKDSKEHLSRLLIYFPKSAYIPEVRKKLFECHYQISIDFFKKDQYHPSLKELTHLQKQKGFSLSPKNKKSIQEYIIKNLFNIALKHYNSKEYYFASDYFNQLIKSYPDSPEGQKAKPYLEESYFKDGEQQYKRKAWRNALSVLRTMLVTFPEGKFSDNAREYINIINRNLDTPEAKLQTDISEKKKSSR